MEDRGREKGDRKEDEEEDDRDGAKMKALSLLSGDQGPLLHCQKDLEELLTFLGGEGAAGKKMKLGRKLVWPWREEKKINEFLEKLERHKSHFMLALSIESYKQLDDVHSVVQDIRDESRQEREQKKGRQAEKEHHKVITWLDTVDVQYKHHSVARLRKPETCSWILNHKTFKAWRNSQSAFLWLHGIPGSGKTVLAPPSSNNSWKKVTTRVLSSFTVILETRRVPAQPFCFGHS